LTDCRLAHVILLATAQHSGWGLFDLSRALVLDVAVPVVLVSSEEPEMILVQRFPGGPSGLKERPKRSEGSE